MANFKASSSSSSSGFVIGTTVLLLLVVMNIYGATAATACSSSKVMLFNSSSLEAVEQVAKDQGLAEFAIDDHEIQRRVLPGLLPGEEDLGESLARTLTNLIDNFKPAKATTDEEKLLKLKFNRYCTMACSKSVANEGNCTCSNKDSKNLAPYVGSSRSCGAYTVYYCCKGENCRVCCEPISEKIKQVSQGFSTPSSASSGPPVIANVVMTVNIAIFTTIYISYMLFF